MKRKSPQKKRKLKDLLLPHRKEMRKAEHLEIGRKKEQRKQNKNIIYTADFPSLEFQNYDFCLKQ